MDIREANFCLRFKFVFAKELLFGLLQLWYRCKLFEEELQDTSDWVIAEENLQLFHVDPNQLDKTAFT
jgi:hypothetical protein